MQIQVTFDVDIDTLADEAGIKNEDDRALFSLESEIVALKVLEGLKKEFVARFEEGWYGWE